MKTLGVVLAGGKSSRFGSDKAAAMLAGRPLLDHALANLARHTDAVAVAGRQVDGVISIADRPFPGLGPLGGLCGALHHARNHGFEQVLSCGVDCPDFPAAALQGAPCYLEAQPVVGLWPATALESLETFLANDPRRAVRGFAAAIGAAAVRLADAPGNINTPEDLAGYIPFRD
jgi:molybdopterin-guanine dinucleotide biosynthesis protein A